MTAATLTLDIVCQMNSMELCEKYFGTRDLYELLNVTKDAVEKDGTCFFSLFFFFII